MYFSTFCTWHHIVVNCIGIASVEEVSMKWMDRPSVTEMDRGGVNEMDGQTKCQKNVNATGMDKI